jgi:hypothetical protein
MRETSLKAGRFDLRRPQEMAGAKGKKWHMLLRRTGLMYALFSRSFYSLQPSITFILTICIFSTSKLSSSGANFRLSGVQGAPNKVGISWKDLGIFLVSST